MSDRRPHIPLSVRVEVIRRMIETREYRTPERARLALWAFDNPKQNTQERIEYGLAMLGLIGAHLDHDPALELRRKRMVKGRLRYYPDANDPDALIYRAKDDHHHKTFGRKPGASRTVTTKGSDVYLIAKFKRLEGKTKPKRKQKIPSRPFPKRLPKR